MKSTYIAIVAGALVLIGLHFVLDRPFETESDSGKEKEKKVEIKKTETKQTVNIKTNTTKAMDTTKLIIEDKVLGTGAEAKAGDSVIVHYVGTLTDGTMFDASRNRGDQGFTFVLGAGQVIKGWDQGVAGMKVGGKRKLTIPSDLAYGNRAVGNVIPANAALVFEVELISVGE